MCTQECPSRRGKRRKDVADELSRGSIDHGVHPQSRLVDETMERLLLSQEATVSETAHLQAQMTELAFTLRCLERLSNGRSQTLRKLMEHKARGNTADLRGDGSQAEAEPEEHDG